MPIAVANTKNKRESRFLKYKKSQKNHPKWIEEFFFKSWWTFLFIFVCYYSYASALDRREKEKIALQKKVEELNKENEKALFLKEELQLQINSQNDPAWIELTLLKGLGLVPEGQTKVFFVQEKGSN